MSINNLVLIGMPGAGKSTLGVLLAKDRAQSFVDTDLLIQEKIGCTLQEYLDEYGYQKLRQLEEDVIVSHRFENCVVATGGSAVYGRNAMAHLQKDGRILYLNISMATLAARVRNQATRGIACAPNSSMEDVFKERQQLYLQYANDIIDMDSMTIDESLEEILKMFKRE